MTRNQPWLVWLCGLRTGLQTRGSQVQFPVRAHAWVAGHVPSRGHIRGNHTLMSPSLSPSLPLALKINLKIFKKIVRCNQICGLGGQGWRCCARGERNKLRRVKLEAIALDRGQDFLGWTQGIDGRERKE